MPLSSLSNKVNNNKSLLNSNTLNQLPINNYSIHATASINNIRQLDTNIANTNTTTTSTLAVDNKVKKNSVSD